MVEVSQHYAIESDGERNIIVLRKVVSKKDGSVSYTNDTYHHDMASALQSILRKETKKFVGSQEGRKLADVASDLMEFERKLVADLIDAVKAGAK